MVNPGGGRPNQLSMLPQVPTPGLLPSAATVQGLLPQNPSTLVPLPTHHRIQAPNPASGSTNILPPTLINRQFFSRGVHEPANHDG